MSQSSERTALITGAARRIGRAIALDLAAHGWRVAIHYRGHDSFQAHRGALTKPKQDQPLEGVLRRIRGEYIEMPELRLTTAQAQRLWGLDRAACEALIGALVDAKFLFRTPDGAFVRS